ncbi:uncharacterized protein LOC118449050 isoform X1 [Vespa mandarinia]|uniref:uncharacterized protein LOC118449050 isoform X1 n=2 Tax=Vespa mandarinia TaxID=7446 RepID=UPI00160BD3F6|nr:uncharacterized protein LOC118449050 isoform X1 [Vespa mandarinia]XP_035739089.1 uncharacterized protein LOC118449050 isoform X1 [Vespa mandarinia]
MGDEIITLILGNDSFKVDKKRLINKSHYFDCLFSPNFYDSRNKEHIINYDIASSTLQDFIEWIHDDERIIIELSHFIKSSMVKYKTDNFIDLLNLLQLAVLFMTDDLISDITDIIILYWLNPEKVIDVWLLAQELAISLLTDVCLSVCLDRFIDLPISSLIELPIKNLKQLIENINVRSTTKYSHYILHEWMDHNTASTINNNVINIPLTRNSKFIQYMIGYKLESGSNKKGYIYCWDGIQLSELVELKYLKCSGRDLIGLQVTGRGFNIYLVGGEYGLGTGQFNQIIWRYCLISKKWYYFARLPSPRRHMIAGFLSNCLIVVGGVGRHRLKLSSVDILDIHTGKWTKAADVPENFTEVPHYSIMRKKLFLLRSSLYIFYPELESWKTIILENIPLPIAHHFMAYGLVIFMIRYNGRILSRISNIQEKICDDCLQLYKDHAMIHTMSDVYPSIGLFIPGIGFLSILSKKCQSCSYSYLQTDDKTRTDPGNLILDPRLGSFYTIDPKTLCEVSTLDNL